MTENLTTGPGKTASAAAQEELRSTASGTVDAAAEALLEFSHRIHELSELSWEERESAAAVARVMEEAGFETTLGAYGVETAVEAVYGSGDLTVVICAEYDALPGVGHACGHNVIAAAGVGAALALKPVADAAGLRVKLLGTPAEEHGGGKVELLKAGAWEDAAFSIMVHGSPKQEVAIGKTHTTAVERIEVTFTGKEAHAAAAPWAAVNAGAAATLALTNLAMLRQHLPPHSNANAFISQAGQATNIIPESSTLQVEYRAGDIETWREVKQRVLNCFEGAAIATGCSWEHHRTEYPYAPVLTHEGLGLVWDANLEALGRPVIRETAFGGGSTDMGNVSQAVPSVHGMIWLRESQSVPHTVGFTADAVSPSGDEAALDGAKALALTALDAALDPELRAELLRLQAEREPGSTTAVLEV
ncbi:amidohydrolase [Brevibacterium album]|uniref:amidohydrolase n=1 Tax=Brevibacterium album TaxID=417948 RepID=UPI000411E9EF|nr:amidohydrolase [Brevibacterium album]